MARTLLAAILVFSMLAQPDSRWQGRIDLRVSGDAEARAQVESYMSRELRSLGDVAITAHDPLYRIRILVDRSVVGNEIVGFVVSIVVTSVPEGEEGEQFLEHGLFQCRPDGLRRLCEKWLAEFDADELKKSREAWEELQRRLKRVR